MEDLKDRLTSAIHIYGNSERGMNFDAEDMAEYLIETIAELHLYEQYNEEISKEINGVIHLVMIFPEVLGIRIVWKMHQIQKCYKIGVKRWKRFHGNWIRKLQNMKQ